MYKDVTVASIFSIIGLFMVFSDRDVKIIDSVLSTLQFSQLINHKRTWGESERTEKIYVNPSCIMITE